MAMVPGTKRARVEASQNDDQFEDIRGPGKNQNYDVRPTMPNIFNLTNKYGFPRSIITKLRYCDTISLTSTTGAVGSYVFRINSCFDPDLTGVGHQPLYYDQFAAIYNYYNVNGAKITFKVSNVDNVPAVVGVTKSPNGSLSSVLSTNMEDTDSVHQVIGQGIGGRPYVELFSTYSMAMDKTISDTSETRAAVGSNPAQSFYIALYLRSLNGTSSVTVNFTVEIDFTVQFEELTNIAGS